MKILHLSFIMLTAIIFLGFGLQPAHADDAYGISIQNIQVQPSIIKVGDAFSVTVTLVNNSTVPIVLEGGTCVPVIKHVPFFAVMLDNHARIKAKNLTCAGVGLSEILNPEKSLTGTSPDSTLTYVATESGTANVTVTFSYRITNQTDLTQPNIEKTMSKSILFTVQDNNTNAISSSMNHSYPATLAQSPLKQFKSGIDAKYVTCQQGLQLVIKSEDGSPACVKSETAIVLVEHRWATNVPQPNPMAGLNDDAGIATLGNQAYYFETANYTDDAYNHPVQISFHDVIFTLFPSGFRGGLPAWGCGGSYYWTDAKFLDGTSELLQIFVGDQQCFVPQPSTHFSNHTNPQAGLTFYNGKMKLLVGTKNTLESSTRLRPVDIVSIQFLPTPPNPGGPTMQVILTNIGMNPVTDLNATLVLNNNYVFNFKDVTESNPLAPGHSTSDTEMLIGVGSTEMTYPLTVVGIENNEKFSYTLNIHIPYTNENEIIKVRR